MRVTAAIRALSAPFALSLLAACAGTGQSSFPGATAAAEQQASAQQLISTSRLAAVSPDKCKTTNGVEVLPCSLTLKSSKQTSVTVSGPGVVQSKAGTTCNAYAKFQYFDYGIWYITPIKKTGTCSITFTGLNSDGDTVGTATLKVKNTY